MIKQLAAAGALALALFVNAAAVQPASAHIVEVTWSGFASNVEGELGLAQEGDAFTVYLKYDTSVPGIGSAGGPNFARYYGGTEYPLPTPLVLASLTIGGNNLLFGGDGDLVYWRHSTSSTRIHAYASGGSHENNFLSFGFNVPLTLALPVGGIGKDAIKFAIAGSFDFWEGDHYSRAHLLPDQVELKVDGVVSAAVPEPSTWAMMILGFAGLGFVAHRSRRRERALQTS